jgi:hypothetical protein
MGPRCALHVSIAVQVAILQGGIEMDGISLNSATA